MLMFCLFMNFKTGRTGREETLSTNPTLSLLAS